MKRMVRLGVFKVLQIKSVSYAEHCARRLGKSLDSALQIQGSTSQIEHSQRIRASTTANVYLKLLEHL
jgi:hypothetical protein